MSNTDLPLLNLNTSLNILIQGVQIAQKAGIYNFQDSASIFQAIHSIQEIASKNKPSETKEAKEAASETTPQPKEVASEPEMTKTI